MRSRRRRAALNVAEVEEAEEDPWRYAVERPPNARWTIWHLL